MMKKVPTIAVAALMLVLSGGAAFAEPPSSVTPNDGPDVERHNPGHAALAVPDVDLAALQGRGLLHAACTVSLKAVGILFFVDGIVTKNPIHGSFGVALFHEAPANCAL